ncbi:hypothetical protein WN51_10024 [Melipona quadrifasciata]|uniref:Uncharacterized protein n=1 Tax=Melipona quadrifasciata TaxID=166423 RepID=A0A0M9ADT8_9HYME|nr:hypothetical protein WN51_10024 [Melipona quadrifasciata]
MMVMSVFQCDNSKEEIQIYGLEFINLVREFDVVMVICLLWEDATTNKIGITALAHVIPDIVLWIDWARREGFFWRVIVSGIGTLNYRW